MLRQLNSSETLLCCQSSSITWQILKQYTIWFWLYTTRNYQRFQRKINRVLVHQLIAQRNFDRPYLQLFWKFISNIYKFINSESCICSSNVKMNFFEKTKFNMTTNKKVDKLTTVFAQEKLTVFIVTRMIYVTENELLEVQTDGQMAAN